LPETPTQLLKARRLILTGWCKFEESAVNDTPSQSVAYLMEEGDEGRLKNINSQLNFGAEARSTLALVSTRVCPLVRMSRLAPSVWKTIA
jgi:hypothetical protein